MPRKPTGRPKGRPKGTTGPNGPSGPQGSAHSGAIVPVSAYIRTVPEAVNSLLELSDRNHDHWKKLGPACLMFVERALALSVELEKPGEALFCAEKAMAIYEKYEALRDRVEQTASNVGIVLEWSRMGDVCKRPALAPVADDKVASA